MKASELKPFEIPTSLLVTTYATRGVAGYSSAYNTTKTGEVEISVFSCKYTEVIIMGGNMLNALIGVVRNNKKTYETIRFYDDNNGGYKQNRNSVPRGLMYE